MCQGLWCKTRNLWSWFKELHDQLLNYCACFFSCITIGVPCSMLKKQRTIILLCIKADRIIHIHSQAIMHHPSKRSRGATTSQKRLRVNLYAFNNLNFLKWYEHTIYTYHRITLKLPLPLSYSLLWNSWLLILKVYQSTTRHKTFIIVIISHNLIFKFLMSLQNRITELLYNLMTFQLLFKA